MGAMSELHADVQTYNAIRFSNATTNATSLANYLREAGFADDEDLICDMIEAETNSLNDVSQVIRWIGEREAMSESLKAYEGDLATRRKRLDDGVATARKALVSFMEATGLKKIERPEGTISVRPGGVQVIYAVDFKPEALDEKFQKWTCAADKAAIKEALQSGEAVPGAVLSNGAPVLTLRVK
jgi:hypothetical protein